MDKSATNRYAALYCLVRQSHPIQYIKRWWRHPDCAGSGLFVVSIRPGCFQHRCSHAPDSQEVCQEKAHGPGPHYDY